MKKLKEMEKLAKEWVIPYPLGNSNIIAVAYLAGFLKAREMAWDSLGETEYAIQPKIQKLLLQLGESEVEDE